MSYVLADVFLDDKEIAPKGNVAGDLIEETKKALKETQGENWEHLAAAEALDRGHISVDSYLYSDGYVRAIYLDDKSSWKEIAIRNSDLLGIDLEWTLKHVFIVRGITNKVVQVDPESIATLYGFKSDSTVRFMFTSQ